MSAQPQEGTLKLRCLRRNCHRWGSHDAPTLLASLLPLASPVGPPLWLTLTRWVAYMHTRPSSWLCTSALGCQSWLALNMGSM
jgi:hypothetical protein